MEKIWFFDFETRTWSSKSCIGGLSSWSFGHAHKRGKHLLAYGMSSPTQAHGSLEVTIQLYSHSALLKAMCRFCRFGSVRQSAMNRAF